MKKDKEIAIHRPTRLSVAILFLLSSILVSCASGPFGKMELDNSVRSSFEQGKLLPEHQYYYAGEPGRPYAIIALNQSVKLMTPFWRQKDFTGSELAAYSLAIERYYMPPPIGSWILDAQGNRIGVWYGSGPTPTVQSPAPDQAKISFPIKPQLK
jgi:hypothetical protein